jgi:hypothetical protein
MAGLRVRRKTRGMKQREVPALGGILVKVSGGPRTDFLPKVITTLIDCIYFGTRGNRCKCGSSRFYASRGGPPMSYL